VIFPSRTLGPVARAHGAPDPNADLKALIAGGAYWKLDEFSDGSGPVTRVDSGPNGYDLADNGNVPSGTGHVYANSANFTAANSEFLSIADPFYLPTLTIECWFKSPDSALGFLVAKDNSGGGGREWGLFKGVGAVVEFAAFTNDSTLVTASATSITYSSYTHVLAWFDDSDKRARIRVNNGAVLTSAALSGSIQNGTGEIQLGARQFAGARNFLTGDLSVVAIYNAVLTTDQQDRLWNGGAGLALY
jgi:hypothetical protein